MEIIEKRHGAGGRIMEEFLKKYIFPELPDDDNDIGLKEADDSATIGDIGFTIDGYTVQPHIFPGGDIGRLSVSGTVNDLLAIGAIPKALLVSMIIEEG
ncbi:MAG: hydrogenase expression/formation protein HypE, partial [Thermoplasmata archaeon]